MTRCEHCDYELALASTDDGLRAEMEQLRTENRQLHRALASHAVIDQAIGVLTLMGQIAPQDGFTVLREVSQHTNTKLTDLAEHILKTPKAPHCPTTSCQNYTLPWPATPHRHELHAVEVFLAVRGRSANRCRDSGCRSRKREECCKRWMTLCNAAGEIGGITAGITESRGRGELCYLLSWSLCSCSLRSSQKGCIETSGLTPGRDGCPCPPRSGTRRLSGCSVRGQQPAFRPWLDPEDIAPSALPR